MAEQQGPVLSLGLVLMQTFLVIFLGASVVRIGMLKPEDARVVGFITGRLALPLLIFRAVATVEIQDVHFTVVGVLVGAKLAVQMLTMAGAALVASRKPGQRLLDAGLYGLYATSSADFPIGFPVVMALFQRKSRMMDDFCSYLTMLAVAQDLLGNVVALVALETGRAQAAAAAAGAGARPARRSLLRSIALNVAGNHLLWMVFGGLAYKLVFGWSLVRTEAGMKLPVGLREAVEVLTSPFKFLVLFQVGLSVGSLTSKGIFTDPLKSLGILLLNMIKLIFLPLLMVTLLLLTWSGPLDKRNQFLTFTLIYGTLPSPAAIVAFARLYGINSEVVGLAVPVGLALSGPIIWMVATLGHLYMHGTDDMWQGDPSVERYLQYPGLFCGMAVVILFATGCSNWRVFPMVSFVHCAITVVGWHIVKLTFLHFGCGVPAVVHYVFQVFNQQVRLYGVVAVWLVWGLLRGIRTTTLKRVFYAVVYMLPLLLAIPAFFGSMELDEHPFWIMCCLYDRGHVQRIVDLAACTSALTALWVGFVLFALSGGFHKQELGESKHQVIEGQLLTSVRGPPPSSLAGLGALDLGGSAAAASPRRCAAARGGGEARPLAARPDGAQAEAGGAAEAAGAGAGEAGAQVAGLKSSAGQWDEALRFRMFVLPALAMSLFAALLLPLDATLAILSPEMSGAWRAAISTGAALVHGALGCALLLLFLWSEPACRLYQAAYARLAACGERFHSGCDSTPQSESDTDDKEEDLSTTEVSSSCDNAA